MSFDVTFHPFAAEEVERYVFDVWRDASLAEARASELSDDALKQRTIVETIYARFPAWREQARGEARGEAPGANETVAFACAALSGYRHFYFYARGSALSFAAEHLPEIIPLFTPLSRLPGAPAELAHLDFNGGLVNGNYSASGLIMPQHFDALRQALDRLVEMRDAAPATLFSLFDAGDREALEGALVAAEGRGSALLEAVDLVVPACREGSTDLDKLRLMRRDPQTLAEEHEVFPCLSKGRCGS